MACNVCTVHVRSTAFSFHRINSVVVLSKDTACLQRATSKGGIDQTLFLTLSKSRKE